MSEADSTRLTSSTTPIAFPFSAFMKSSVAEQSFMSAATTNAPAADRLRANSCPSPRAAPVMMTTLSRTVNSVVAVDHRLIFPKGLGAPSTDRETSEVGLATGLNEGAPRGQDTGIRAGTRARAAVWPDPLLAASDGRPGMIAAKDVCGRAL